MSIRAFADHIGVSHRMISKWEAGGSVVHPRPGNQEALDTAFATASDEIKERFLTILRQPSVRAPLPSKDLVMPTLERFEPITHDVDRKLMVHIDAGVFLSHTDNNPVWLVEFWIDVFPITNADYAAFVNATGHQAPKHWPNGKPPSELSDHPVVFVAWTDASAYAKWAGKQLPSSLQWEKAARGNAGNVYPWGQQATAAKCNVRDSGVGTTTAVSCYQSGVSPYGVYDMCGNTWEWCSTETTDGRYELKGSAFTSPFYRARPSSFNDAAASMLDDDTSFRCITVSPRENRVTGRT